MATDAIRRTEDRTDGIAARELARELLIHEMLVLGAAVLGNPAAPDWMKAEVADRMLELECGRAV